MGRKVGIYALCTLFLVQILAGCAGPGQQPNNTFANDSLTNNLLSGCVIGGIGGTLVGWLSGGNAKGAGIGAAAGCITGALVNWQVGEYRAQQIKSAQEAAAAHAYRPQQGVVTKIDKTAATPHQVKPGDWIVFQTTYTYLAPPERGEVTVREVRTISFNNQELGSLESKDTTVKAGTETLQQRMQVNQQAAPGKYTVKTIVQRLDDQTTPPNKATTTFVVGRR